MKRFSLLSGLIVALAAGGTCQAQQINTSQSRTVTLTDAQLARTGVNTPLDRKATLNPVMTRAIAQRDAQGKLVVKCQVEPSPMAHAGNPTHGNEQTRKIK